MHLPLHERTWNPAVPADADTQLFPSLGVQTAGRRAPPIAFTSTIHSTRPWHCGTKERGHQISRIISWAVTHVDVSGTVLAELV